MKPTQKDENRQHHEPHDAYTPPPFNSVDDHYQKYMGMSRKKVNLNQLPTPLRWFGYFFYAVILAGGIAFVVSMVFYYLIP